MTHISKATIYMVMMVFLFSCAQIKETGTKIKVGIVSAFSSTKSGVKKDLLKKASMLRGKVTVTGSIGGEIIVAAITKEYKQQRVDDVTILQKPGEYSLAVVEGGYRIFAFIDENGNRTYDLTERAAVYNQSQLVSPIIGEITFDLDLNITKNRPEFRDIKVKLSKNHKQSKIKPLFTKIKRFDDYKFGKNTAKEGYWSPYKFIKTIGENIYSLEPYDPNKVPILLVHGAVGTPRNWEQFPKNIDTNRYQIWFFHYPSGIRLKIAAELLHRKLTFLQQKYQFEKLHLSAHSMGGLVSRYYLNHFYEPSGANFIKLFTTHSTPWGGHDGAKDGVEKSPVAVHSWQDVATGSLFLSSLHKTKLPEGIDYYLFYGFGGNNRFNEDADDGTITLKSQLDDRVQKSAIRLFGYDEGHVSILSSAKMFRDYASIIEKY